MGGVALVSTQFARANNPRLEENWNPNQKQKYIFVVDCTNQYGWSMMQYLPVYGFEWIDWSLSTQEWVEFLKKQEDAQEKGYFFRWICIILDIFMIYMISTHLLQSI